MADSALPEPLIYLHGDLDLTIIEASNLPNMDLMSEHLRRCFAAGRACIAHGGNGGDDNRIDHRRKIITTDPYVAVYVPHATVATTQVIHNEQNPRWNQHFNIPLAHRAPNLEFQVRDMDLFGPQLIGKVIVPAEKLASGELITDRFPVIGAFRKPSKPEALLHLKMKFTPCDDNPLYQHGIAGDPQHKGVRHTYFPLRRGCSVQLYQDAHVSNDIKLPDIELDEGGFFKQGKCWEDLCHAILEARHLIYMVGWSISLKVKLIREPTRPLPRGGNLSLGDLLKYKSEEGVRVLLLVWNDKTSQNKFFVKTPGVMKTHDEDTKKFFKRSSVICVLSPRYASSKLSYIRQKVVGTFFTHHQKCVLVDTQAGNNRKITAFLGGLDLCDGRYDTPEHRLFRDLSTVFRNDFHNSTFPKGNKAPRQPWHDMHCRIDGPAAFDVLINFEQRWIKASKWTELGLWCRRIPHWHDDAMIKIKRISWILSPDKYSFPKDKKYTTIPEDDPKVWVSQEDNRENWHVQIFRSIDSGSLKRFPKSIDVAEAQVEAQSLICSNKLVIDRSIQTAYIQAIRSAQHFIYIENQYFIGSSYAWPSYENAGVDNLVPMELALKIASKIRARERFAVYVVIPMWPEGDPTSAAMQEILFWQSQTMKMMYGLVAQELKSMQLSDSNPLDYLNFYCLGNREQMLEERSTEGTQSPANENKVLDVEKFRRFMVYVHAKGMIVDDEYTIIGSANINQRSLDGTRDTEIAMGAYQPDYTWAKKKKYPHGQIYGHRMSLWAEHLGTIEECFKEPESLECVKRVNHVAEDNWKKYTDSNFTPLQGHLLKYPVHVDDDGTVGSLPGHESFPDVGGKVLGAYSSAILNPLTT
ncbi:unnamed protein product [Camellia sinensis]